MVNTTTDVKGHQVHREVDREVSKKKFVVAPMDDDTDFLAASAAIMAERSDVDGVRIKLRGLEEGTHDLLPEITTGASG